MKTTTETKDEAMTSRTIKANYLFLDRGNHFVYSGKNVYAPMAKCRASDIEEYLDAVGDDTVTVECKIHPDFPQDQKMYTRRIAKALSERYTFSGFSTKVIDGYEQENVLVGTITREVSGV